MLDVESLSKGIFLVGVGERRTEIIRGFIDKPEKLEQIEYCLSATCAEGHSQDGSPVNLT